MSNTVRFLWFPAVIMAAVLLSRRWPDAMRRDSRLLAAINGVALLCIIATGWLPRIAPVGAIHRWLPHGLFIVDWTAIPFAIGEILVRFRMRPVAAAARVAGLLMFLGVLFLSSITGYLGPSYGPIDPMNFRRFQILHYGVFPAFGIALVIWWYDIGKSKSLDRTS
jgi:hypothetical protein